MLSPLVNATLQAAALSAVSNFLGQVFRAYKSGRPLELNVVPIAHFVIFTFLSCPPNFLWQEFLEERFPGYNGEKKLNLRNTLVKFAVDQTLGATANTVTFVAAMSAFKGKSRTGILHDCQKGFFPLLKSGWKLWPAVSLFNFVVVPVHRRIVVSSLVGLFWGIYLSLVVAEPHPAEREIPI